MSTKFRTALFASAALALLVAPGFPCTAFLVCGNGRVLLGNNEDFWNPNTRMWFVPETEGRHGRVYLGYDNMYPQGGMNDAGLAFDGFATERYPMREQAGKAQFEGNLIDEVMATCGTVDEVVALLEGFDLRMLENAMLMFADATGDSVIVEGDAFVRKEGSFQVVTNFYQSRQANDRAVCLRFDAASSILESAPEVNVALCRRALAAAAQEGVAKTLYSNVFDLAERRLYLYHFHNFEEVLEFDLDEELVKGERVLEIAELFPETFAYRSWLNERERKIEERRRELRGPKVERETLDEYAGRYRIDLPDESRSFISFRREGDELLAQGDDDEKAAALITGVAPAFYHVDMEGTQEFRFSRDAEGRVVGLRIKSELYELSAERVTDDD